MMKNNISYMRYYLRRIGYNNYILILPKCQIKFFKPLNLGTIPQFKAKTNC